MCESVMHVSCVSRWCARHVRVGDARIVCESVVRTSGHATHACGSDICGQMGVGVQMGVGHKCMCECEYVSRRARREKKTAY
jgi:hypothetical protein